MFIRLLQVFISIAQAVSNYVHTAKNPEGFFNNSPEGFSELGEALRLLPHIRDFSLLHKTMYSFHVPAAVNLQCMASLSVCICSLSLLCNILVGVKIIIIIMRIHGNTYNYYTGPLLHQSQNTLIELQITLLYQSHII